MTDMSDAQITLALKAGWTGFASFPPNRRERMAFRIGARGRWLCARADAEPPCSKGDCTWPGCMAVDRSLRDRAELAEAQFVKMLADNAAWQRKHGQEFDRATRAEATAASVLDALHEAITVIDTGGTLSDEARACARMTTKLPTPTETQCRDNPHAKHHDWKTRMATRGGETYLQSESFEDWFKRVSAVVQHLTGLSVEDLPDACFRDWFEDGVKPVSAARRVIRQSMD